MKSRSESWAYFDSSAFAKRYLHEPGHLELDGVLARRRIVSSVLLPLELQSAVARRVREGRLATAAQPRVLERIANDRRHWTLIDISEVTVAAEALLEGHQVRTLDAIHVASAQAFAARSGADMIFVTADARQARAASSVGLAVRTVRP